MSAVYLLVREVSQLLKNAGTGEELSSALTYAQQELLNSKANSPEFFSKHFSAFCRADMGSDHVLQLLSELDARSRERLFSKFFLVGPPCESLLSLCEIFGKCK